MTKNVLVAMTVLAMVGCGTLREQREDAKRAEAEIKAEIGVDSAIGVRSVTGTQGSKVLVGVRLKTMPSGDTAAIRAKVDGIVAHTFRSHVDQVTIAF